MSITAFYTVGRVKLTQGSKLVEGLGTAWIGAAIREGDDFRINGAVVRIERVIDNTNMELAFAWAGASITDAQYEIKYTPDTDRILGASREIITSINATGLNSLKTLAPSKDTMPYYTGLDSASTTPLTEFGRQMVAGASQSAIQALLGLVPQDSATDSVIEKLLKVGAFGLGSLNAPQLQNINSFTTPAGFYRIDGRMTTGNLPPNSNTADALIVLRPTESQTIQVYLGMTELGRNYIRKSNSDGSWSVWRSIMMDFEFGVGPGSGLDADSVDGYHADDFMKVSDYGSGSMIDLIKAVDGPDSGLDADLLDGLHATSFGRYSVGGTWTGIQNFSNVLRTSTAASEQAQFGYGYTGNTQISLYNGTTLSGYIQNAPSNGIALVSHTLGGVLRVGTAGEAFINDVQLATQPYVSATVNDLVNSSAETLETLNKLKEALGGEDVAAGLNAELAKKLNIIDFTGAAILERLLTVDGAGSGLDADLLDGQSSAFYRSASNINSGVLSASFLPLEAVTNDITLTAGDGLSGGGNLAASRSFAVDSTVVRTTRTISPGDGLTGGGSLAANRTLAVDTTVARRNGSNYFSGNQVLSGGALYIDAATATANALIWLRDPDGKNRGLFWSDAGPNTRMRAYTTDRTSYRELTLNGDNGIVYATGFSGSGRNLTNMDAANFDTGTLPDARLPDSMSGKTFTGLTTGTILKATSRLEGNPNDSAAAPSFTFTGDLDTGMYRYAADHIGFATAGVQRVVITATGIHGVGTHITQIDAGNLDRGTLPNGRLNGNYSFNHLTLNNGFRVNNQHNWTNTCAIVGNVPSIWFGHSDGPSAYIGVNGKSFYILEDANSDGSFETTSLQVDLDGTGVSYYGKNLAYQQTNIEAGPGLTGGGTLAGNRTISLGVPEAITADSGNSRSATGHTHFISRVAVLELTSRSLAGEVGTYAFMRRIIEGTINPGNNIAGSNLRYAAAAGAITGDIPAGTWKCMGYATSYNGTHHDNNTTLYLRIG